MHTTIKLFPFFALALLVTCIHATPDEELILAARSNDTGGVRRALEQNADPNVTDRLSQTALHCAAHYDNAEAAQLLLARSAEKEARNHHGMTPLHLAAYWRSPRVAKLLLDFGAKNIEELNGMTPLDIAHHLEHHDIADLFGTRKGRSRKTGPTQIRYTLISVPLTTRVQA